MAKHQKSRLKLMDALLDMADEIEGSPILIPGSGPVWVHTTRQVDDWLRALRHAMQHEDEA